MTHAVPVTMLGDYILTEWFLNSMEPLGGETPKGGIWYQDDSIHKTYEDTYGVKVLFDVFGWVSGVEFASKDHAVEFILRWSCPDGST